MSKKRHVPSQIDPFESYSIAEIFVLRDKVYELVPQLKDRDVIRMAKNKIYQMDQSLLIRAECAALQSVK